MPRTNPATYERLTPLDASSATLIEGLPGHGLVSAIAVDQITRQLGLQHHGSIVSDDFPPVASFQDGLVHDLVRVFAGTNPDVLTLQSELALPPSSFDPLAQCLIDEFSAEFERAIFITGTPAEDERRAGDITGVGTNEEMLAELESVGVARASDPGLLTGATGAMVKQCYHADIPAIALIVKSNPFLPDPGAARQVIEEAVEPLVEFDIDTSELREQADEIQSQLRQLAEQYEQVQRERRPASQQGSTPGMFQ